MFLLIFFTVIVCICILWPWISFWMTCRYSNLFSAQLCKLWLSRCCPNNGGGATNVFYTNRSCMLVFEFSLYLASRFVGKFGGIVVCEIWVKEGVEGGERVSGRDKDVSDEMSIGSFTKFGSPWVKACVIRNGRRPVVVGGLKGFSLICSDVGVEPK